MQTIEQQYPNIAAWVQDGWIEIGYTDYVESFIRALDEGGTVWEGDDVYETLDQALAAAEVAIAEWLGVNAPDAVASSEPPPHFTPKQGQYLAFIHNYMMLTWPRPGGSGDAVLLQGHAAERTQDGGAAGRKRSNRAHTEAGAFDSAAYPGSISARACAPVKETMVQQDFMGLTLLGTPSPSLASVRQPSWDSAFPDEMSTILC